MGLRTLFYIALVYVLWRVYQDSFGKKASRSKTKQQAMPPRKDESTGAYHILGVSPDSTLSEVRIAYQKLIQQYHPDRVDDMGEELRTLAETKTKEINQAYNEIKNRYN